MYTVGKVCNYYENAALFSSPTPSSPCLSLARRSSLSECRWMLLLINVLPPPLLPHIAISSVVLERGQCQENKFLSVGMAFGWFIHTVACTHTHTAMQLKKLLLSLFRSLVDSHWIMISWFASLASFRECALKSNKISSGIAFQSNNDFYHKPHHNQLNLIAIAYPLSIFIK